MLIHLPSWLRQHLAALRILLVFTVVLGIAYPAAVLAVAQLPGLSHKANGSLLTANGHTVGSSLIGQSFTTSSGQPIRKYFQSRPSDAGAGYDPTSTSASNLGPEQIIDALANPVVKGDTGSPALLTQVCTRSMDVGELEHVDGRRPYCTANGVGAVLSVIGTHGLTGAVTRVVSVNQECPARPFLATYDGVQVSCATYGVDYRIGRIAVVHGPGKAWPANPVPPDAVTASGSGLDPDISTAYADLQAPRVARVRGLPLTQVQQLIHRYTTGRTLGFMGEPAVDVLELNLALDRISDK